MFSYTAKKQGFRTVSFTNRRLAMAFINKGYSVDVFKDGKKIYVMSPVGLDKSEKV